MIRTWEKRPLKTPYPLKHTYFSTRDVRVHCDGRAWFPQRRRVWKMRWKAKFVPMLHESIILVRKIWFNIINKIEYINFFLSNLFLSLQPHMRIRLVGIRIFFWIKDMIWIYLPCLWSQQKSSFGIRVFALNLGISID